VIVYSVYEPQAEAPDLATRADRLAFVREGFSWPALLIPAFWLIYQRMWIELAVFVLLLAGLQWLFGVSAQGQSLFGWVSLALIVLFAFEANDLRTAALERRGYHLAGVAAGRSREAAELRFFCAWLPQQSRRARDAQRGPGGAERGREPTPYAGPPPEAEGDEVIGLFPSGR
jgi:Protein of unknown function (DUF2628)